MISKYIYCCDLNACWIERWKLDPECNLYRSDFFISNNQLYIDGLQFPTPHEMHLEVIRHKWNGFTDINKIFEYIALNTASLNLRAMINVLDMLLNSNEAIDKLGQGLTCW